MLGEYFQGTLPQLIERGRLLKGKIPRNLPRDYDALIRTSEIELQDIIGRLRTLQNLPANKSRALHHARLRQFKRAVADLDHIETRAIAVLNRAQADDHHVNRLLYKICQEIGYPLVTPTVTTLSTGYFYIDTKLNLMSSRRRKAASYFTYPTSIMNSAIRYSPTRIIRSSTDCGLATFNVLRKSTTILPSSGRKKISDAAHGGSRTKSTRGKSCGRSIG
jgi:hypothetical protein